MTSDHDEDRVPAWIDLPARQPEEPPQSPPGDRESRDDEDRRLGERGQVLRLAVAVGVAGIGRPPGDANRNERQQRRDQVGARMRGLGEQAEAAGCDPGDELHPDQHARGDDRDERGAALRAHAAEGSHVKEKGPPRGGPFAGRAT